MSDNSLIVQAVQFMDDVVSISYSEEREQSKIVGVGRSIFVKVEVVEEEVQELLDLVKDIIDKGLLSLRNPPSSVPRSHGPQGAATRFGGSPNPSAMD